MAIIQASVNPNSSLCLFHKRFISDLVMPAPRTHSRLRAASQIRDVHMGLVCIYPLLCLFKKWPLPNVPFIERAFLRKQGRVDPFCFCFCHKATHCVSAREWQGVTCRLVYVGSGIQSSRFLLSKKHFWKENLAEKVLWVKGVDGLTKLLAGKTFTFLF